MILLIYFYECNDIYINALEQSIPLNEIEDYIKLNKTKPINKLSDLDQIGSHSKRENKAYKSNPDIDISKNNIEIVLLADKYIKGFYELTKEYKQKHDK